MDDEGKSVYQDVCYPVTKEFRESGKQIAEAELKEEYDFERDEERVR